MQDFPHRQTRSEGVHNISFKAMVFLQANDTCHFNTPGQVGSPEFAFGGISQTNAPTVPNRKLEFLNSKLRNRKGGRKRQARKLPARTKEELRLELRLNETHIKFQIGSLDMVPVKPGLILIDNDNGKSFLLSARLVAVCFLTQTSIDKKGWRKDCKCLEGKTFFDLGPILVRRNIEPIFPHEARPQTSSSRDIYPAETRNTNA